MRIDDLFENEFSFNNNDEILLVIDRLSANRDEDTINRLGDSIQTAFYEGNGELVVKTYDKETTSYHFSNRFELDGIEFEEPSEHLFTFNNPVGACPKCEGFGSVIGIDEDLVISYNFV